MTNLFGLILAFQVVSQSTTSYVQSPLQLSSYLDFLEIAAPATPAGNSIRLYARDKSGVAELFYKNDSGVERDLSTAGGSGAPADAEYVVSEANGTLSAEVSPAADDQVVSTDSSTSASWKTLSNGAVSYSTAGNAFSQAGITNLASSTSADLRATLSDEVGSGTAMFGLDVAMADGLSCTGSQVVRRNAGDTAFECATVSGGGLTHPEVMSRASLTF